ncbi:MAG: DUF5362 family protein [Bacteroidota bacterium]|nr:DUF5362 family protein [Bacteroidota bacterium]
MENHDLLINDLQVSPQGLSHLAESARWGKFLAIMGFIFCGLMVIIAFFIPVVLTQVPPYNTMSSSFTSGMRTGMTVVYLVLAFMMFFPCFYLYKFSVKMQSAIRTVNQENFDESLINLKSMFRFYGVFTIIILSVYALIIIGTIITAAIR